MLAQVCLDKVQFNQVSYNHLDAKIQSFSFLYRQIILKVVIKVFYLNFSLVRQSHPIKIKQKIDGYAFLNSKIQ